VLFKTARTADERLPAAALTFSKGHFAHGGFGPAFAAAFAAAGAGVAEPSRLLCPCTSFCAS
jgi:hypothetical protein